MSSTRAFVPLTHPTGAYLRLHQELTARQRHELYFSLARRVLGALSEISGLRGIVIATSSTEVDLFAGHSGARVAHQPRDAGVNAALQDAITRFGATDAGALIVAGDLPLVSAEALEGRLQAAHADERGVVTSSRTAIMWVPMRWSAVTPGCHPDAFRPEQLRRAPAERARSWRCESSNRSRSRSISMVWQTFRPGVATERGGIAPDL